MALPTNWPPQPATNNRSIRAFVQGTTTADFEDNAYIFIDLPGANTYTERSDLHYGTEKTVYDIGTTPGYKNITQICANTIQVTNDDTNAIEVSFDGTNVQGVVLQGETICWRDRREAGIALRFPGGGGASDFRLEAW